MFKGKIGTWVITLVVCIFLWLIIDVAIPSFGKDGDIIINSEITENDTFLRELGGNKFSKYKAIISNENPELVFSAVEQKEGYKKYENFISSPIVVYFPQKISSNSDGFSLIGKSTSYTVPIKCDLKNILSGIEQDKTWEEIGYSKKALEGKVKLIIPNESSILYGLTKELFLNNMYNIETMSEEDLKVADKRITDIMNKCVKVFDVNSAIHDAYQKNGFLEKDQTAVIVAPEYLYYQIGDAASSSYEDSYIPTYPLQSVFINANLFCVDTEDAEKIEKYEKVLKNFKDKDKLFVSTGWRINARTYNLSSVLWNEYK